MITIAITTRNRVELTLRSFAQVIDHPLVSEVVIVDDCSDHKYYGKLAEKVRPMDKVKLIRNIKNVGCYHNKHLAVSLASNKWVCLLDSDNVIDATYFDSLPQLHDHVIYAPSFAKPHFDYRNFARQEIKATNVKEYMGWVRFDCLINTCNYVVNREQYLQVWEDRQDPWTADTLFFNYCWLNAGGSIYVVAGMEYLHTVDDFKGEESSHYQKNVQKTGRFADEIMAKLKRL